MASSFRQWESDPLFSAAEVVQDSADRMESLYRLLLHEQSLVQADHRDPKLLKSIEYHKRDLATTLETAKWQLEDFDREVSLSAAMDKSHNRENVISRHKQFVRAIREQITDMERSLKGTLVGDSLRSTQWVNLDEQDRNGLALFLSGENPGENISSHDLEDTDIVRRFPGPTIAPGLNDEIVEQSTGEIKNSNMNGFVHLDKNYDLQDKSFRKVGSQPSTQMAFEAPLSLRGAASDRHGEDGSWDLEANETTGKSFFHKNHYSRMNVFRSLGALWSTFGTSRSFAKRLKDGDEQGHSPSNNIVSSAIQGHLPQTNLASGCSYCQVLLARLMWCSWLGECRLRYRRSPYFTQLSRHFVQLLSAILVILIILVILATLLA